MNKRFAFIAAAAATLLFVTVPASAPASADPSSLSEVKKELKDKGNDLEKITEKYNGAKADLKATEKKISKIKKDLPKLEKEAGKAKDLLGDIAYESYTSGNHLTATGSALADSPEEALKRISVLGAINAAQAADVADEIGAVKDLKEKRKSLEELKDDQKHTKSDISKKRGKIQAEVDHLQDLRDQYGIGSGSGGTAPPPSGHAKAVVAYAENQIGEPYSYGAAGPGSWDCSGLTMMSWRQAGVSLSHQASAQRNETASVSRSELAPGDLVFYYGDIHHVALYVGEGKVVHAPQEGENVQVANMDDMPINSYGRPS
ncbi:MAG TPA: NlpC/P60 family protein [Stackebrandtia sp.]|uniref:C40 family peptidase n=1 Tax=Stackebrandtia sp. TaxID=2023065 RepID=UPI002D2FFE90|nr:NlpC/P60 family protein [Stackebrandtia sp.]HZE38560.1 NlpC/P60 family protein [Stackebrandtia sp.]